MIDGIALSTLARRANGCLQGDDLLVDQFCTDSRMVRTGDMFIALRGEKFDGHSHVADALDKGAKALLLEQRLQGSDISQVIVEDTRKALGVIGLLNREKFTGQVVGLTGSSGKTTTKNILLSILSNAAPTLATSGNFNNEIGVPLTLMSIQDHHSFAIVEMGARKVGDIAYLAGLVKPNVSLLLNVGSAHIDIFGSYENILITKSEIFDVLDDQGIAVFYADDLAVDRWREQNSGRRCLSFGIESERCDLRATNISLSSAGASFELHLPDSSMSVTLPLPGKHNVLNALAAAAVAHALGISKDHIVKGLSEASNDGGRLERVQIKNGATLIDDSYNANPASMKSAIDVLSLSSGRKIAALGDMAELGSFAEGLYKELANEINKTSIDQFLVIGKYADILKQELADRCFVFESKQEMADHLANILQPGDCVLVKGSRSAGMEEVVKLLKEAQE